MFRYLIPLLLQYDSTAGESDKTDAHGVGTSVQIAKNSHAVQASNALSRLSGLGGGDSPAPYNEAAADALKALLTPKLASMLKENSPKDLLSILNSNLESPEVSDQFLEAYLSFFLSLSLTHYISLTFVIVKFCGIIVGCVFRCLLMCRKFISEVEK